MHNDTAAFRIMATWGYLMASCVSNVVLISTRLGQFITNQSKRKKTSGQTDINKVPNHATVVILCTSIHETSIEVDYFHKVMYYE